MNRQEVYKMLRTNGLISSFRAGSDSVINNFLHNTEDIKKEQYVDMNIDAIMAESRGCKNTDFSQIIKKHSKIYSPTIIYWPFDKQFIINLIRLDIAFRESLSWNEPLVVYRGAPPITANALSGIVSTSTDIDIAKDFYKGALIKMELPAGFPYIKLAEIQENDVFNVEEEVILPPCEIVDIVQSNLPYSKDIPNLYKFYEIKVKPKNLAECFYKRMKNPPKEYLKSLDKIDKKRFEEAKKMLKDYLTKVKNNKVVAESLINEIR